MNPESENRARALKFIILAMIGGLLAFLCITVVMVEGGTMKVSPDNAGTLLLVLVFMAVGEFVGYVVLRSVMLGKAVSQDAIGAGGSAREAEMGAFATLTLIGCAMAEGLGLFGTVIFMITGHRLGIVAAGLGVLLIAAQWPTQAKLAAYTGE